MKQQDQPSHYGMWHLPQVAESETDTARRTVNPEKVSQFLILTAWYQKMTRDFFWHSVRPFEYNTDDIENADDSDESLRLDSPEYQDWLASVVKEGWTYPDPDSESNS